jgi:hypothetical protein
MSDKSTIETLIDTNLATATAITAIEVRDTLKDNANSLLNNFYPTEQSDTQATESILTLSTPGIATFDITVLKTGRKVSISGVVSHASGGAISNLGAILAGELTAITGQNYNTVGYIQVVGSAIGVIITNSGGVTTLSFSPSLSVGETIQFTIFYNTNV